MNKNLENLLQKGLIKQVSKSLEQVKKLLEIAERDLKTAKTLLDIENFDWAFAVSYNSMLQASKAFMLSKGFAPSTTQTHLAVIIFAKNFLRGKIDESLLLLFDKIRKVRHQTLYDSAGFISFEMAKQALDASKIFLGIIKKETKM